MAQDWQLFGYGSLVWRPGFDFIASAPAYLHGWERRFWQGSEDHRGVPGDPGRVVTLIPAAQGRCLGRVFRIAGAEAEEIVARLDVREQGGYERREANVIGLDGNDLGPSTFYIATPENPNWLGPAPVAQMSEQIGRCEGPSGPNREYLLALVAWLEQHGAAAEESYVLRDQILRSRSSPRETD